MDKDPSLEPTTPIALCHFCTQVPLAGISGPQTSPPDDVSTSKSYSLDTVSNILSNSGCVLCIFLAQILTRALSSQLIAKLRATELHLELKNVTLNGSDIGADSLESNHFSGETQLGVVSTIRVLKGVGDGIRGLDWARIKLATTTAKGDDVQRKILGLDVVRAMRGWKIWASPAVDRKSRLRLRVKTAREVEEGLLDFELVKSWISYCDRHHRCNASGNEDLDASLSRERDGPSHDLPNWPSEGREGENDSRGTEIPQPYMDPILLPDTGGPGLNIAPDASDSLPLHMQMEDYGHESQRDEADHDDSGATDERPLQHQQIYLIDVHQRTVVVAPSNARYAALSYVYGRPSTQHTITRRKSAPTTRGLDSNMSARLPTAVPQTIEDAMTLVQCLGEQFLWVDMYCINQSDPDEKQEQMNNMDQIYAGAILTIIVLDGEDAQSGICGISRPLQRDQQLTVGLPDGLLVATKLPNFEESVISSPWNQRAWTMQEALLSKRRLCFADDQAYLWCGEDIFYDLFEMSFSEMSGAKTPGIFRTNIFSGMSNIMSFTRDSAHSQREYESLVATYSMKQLTYSSDALNAIRGVLNSAGRRFRAGLPLDALNHALAWEGVTALSRRPEFPSWSWLGWEGAVNYNAIQSQRVGLRFTPAVPWGLSLQGQALILHATDTSLRLRSQVTRLRVMEDSDWRTQGFWRVLDLQGRPLVPEAPEHPSLMGEPAKIGFQVSKDIADELQQRDMGQPLEFLLLMKWKTAEQFLLDARAELEARQQTGAVKGPDPGRGIRPLPPRSLADELQFMELDLAEKKKRDELGVVWSLLMLRNRTDDSARRTAFVRIPLREWENASPEIIDVRLV